MALYTEQERYLLKKAVFFLCYFLSPFLPLILYLGNTAGDPATYKISVFFGVYAFIMLCNQFILAARPKCAVDALSMKGLLSFHGTMPVVILACAAIHRTLKALVGFPMDSLQARLGMIVWVSLAGITVFTAFFMAQTFWLHINIFKKLKSAIYAKTGLTYARARVLHNLTVVLGALILFHVLLASSSDSTVNPAGMAVMILWMIGSLLVYLRYRLRGRTLKGR